MYCLVTPKLPSSCLLIHLNVTARDIAGSLGRRNCQLEVEHYQMKTSTSLELVTRSYSQDIRYASSHNTTKVYVFISPLDGRKVWKPFLILLETVPNLIAEVFSILGGRTIWNQ